MPDSKTILPVLKGVARYVDQDQFLAFCEDYLPKQFFQRMKWALVDLWLAFHGSPEDPDESELNPGDSSQGSESRREE